MSKLMRFINQSVHRKILAGFGVIIVLILGSNAFFYVELTNVSRVSEEALPASELLVHLQDYALVLSTLDSDLDRLFVIGGAEIEENITQDLKELEMHALAIQAGAPDTLSTDSQRLVQLSAELAAETERLVELRLDSGVAVRTINKQTIAVYSILESATQTQEALTDGTLNTLEQIFNNQQRIIANTLTLVTVVGLIIMVVATGASYLISNAIVQPLTTITGSARQISDGDYSQQIQVTALDEVGQLAEAFNQMVRAVKDRENSLSAARRQAEEATRLKDLFLATMSHELRTPLNGIIGFTALMLYSAQLDDENEHMAERVMANAERLLGLINNILDLSRIASGRLEITPVPVNPRYLAEAIYDDMTLQVREKELDFTLALDENLPVEIIHDEERIVQIATNLIGNAIKFTDEGGIHMVFKGVGNRLVIQVTDTGMGIPPTKQQLIFDEFTQLDMETTRKHGGAGLGLSIVKRLAILMEGSVNVDSDVGQGSTFTVELPLNLTTIEPVALVGAA